MSACGSDRPGSTNGTQSAAERLPVTAGLDPCTLVTAAEAAEALGVTSATADRPDDVNREVRSPSYSGGEDSVVRMSTCQYTGERGPGLAVLTIMVRENSSTNEAASAFEGIRTTYAGHAEVTDVADLGQQAFWIPGFAGLWVLDGTLQLNVAGDVDVERARALAAGALERLR